MSRGARRAFSCAAGSARAVRWDLWTEKVKERAHGSGQSVSIFLVLTRILKGTGVYYYIRSKAGTPHGVVQRQRSQQLLSLLDQDNCFRSSSEQEREECGVALAG